jgi:hypothetical protein
MSDLKPCPFCEGRQLKIVQGGNPWIWKYLCADCKSSSEGEDHHVPGYAERLIDNWNTRPIEDKLRADLALAVKALETIAEWKDGSKWTANQTLARLRNKENI